MDNDLTPMFEQLAEYGTAPSEGCGLFSVGHGEAFDRMCEKYLVERFKRGGAAEKFVVGPFGSGKTHFLRQLMERARELDCVTAEVALNKNVDFTQGLVVYQEILREIRAPGQSSHGIRVLLQDVQRRLESRAEAAGMPPEQVLAAWIAALGEKDFASLTFGRVLRRAFDAQLQGNPDQFEAAARWLEGEVSDRTIAHAVGEAHLTSAEVKVHAHRARLSLFQFIRHAGYRGTVVGFDEAEQGMAVDKKRMSRIFSHLLSEINAIVDLKDGSALVVYGVTPDVIEKIGVEVPMLAQRLADPGPQQGFFDGNPLAPKIDLTRRVDGALDLQRIGESLTRLFFARVEGAESSRQEEALAALPAIATAVANEEASSSARRMMVKRVCTDLVTSYMAASYRGPSDKQPVAEAEV